MTISLKLGMNVMPLKDGPKFSVTNNTSYANFSVETLQFKTKSTKYASVLW
jgi:hypothetical protein